MTLKDVILQCDIQFDTDENEIGDDSNSKILSIEKDIPFIASKHLFKKLHKLELYNEWY